MYKGNDYGEAAKARRKEIGWTSYRAAKKLCMPTEKLLRIEGNTESPDESQRFSLSAIYKDRSFCE